jgi:hypothetical protein
LYATLGRYLGERRIGHHDPRPLLKMADGLRQSGVNSTGWPFAALEFFARRMGPQQLAKSAKVSGDRDQLCEGYFFSR